ncbi:MAG: hypothetical protein JWN86_334, partial [Planctomycetota bacterium]|nr:hypothetical protein [Planctomycetota bacterium]
MSQFRHVVSALFRRPIKRSRPALRLAAEGLEPKILLSTYDVGPGQPYATIGAVPWAGLGAGDTVAIHWQS